MNLLYTLGFQKKESNAGVLDSFTWARENMRYKDLYHNLDRLIPLVACLKLVFVIIKLRLSPKEKGVPEGVPKIF